MTLAVSLSQDAERRLASRANAEGVDVSTLASRLLESAVRTLEVPSDPLVAPPDPTRELLRKWSEESKALTSRDMERGEQEFRELMENMNANRRESEGPDARTPFP